jgi:hypothetical protein
VSHARVAGDAREPGSALAGDVIVVRGLAADHGAERDHRVEASGRGDAPHHRRQVECTRHADELEA